MLEGFEKVDLRKLIAGFEIVLQRDAIVEEPCLEEKVSRGFGRGIRSWYNGTLRFGSWASGFGLDTCNL